MLELVLLLWDKLGSEYFKIIRLMIKIDSFTSKNH